MHRTLAYRVIRDPKRLFRLYRRGGVPPNLLASWQNPGVDTPLPAAILGKVHRMTSAKEPRPKKYRKLDPDRGEALLSLAEHLVSSTICDKEVDGEVLFALDFMARFYRYWIRPVTDFCSTSHNLERLLGSLYYHLFVEFPIPAFFYNVLFKSEKDDRIVSQILIGQGVSLRSHLIRMSLPLTAKGCHWFLRAPDWYSYDEAMQWAYYKSFGMSDAITGSLMRRWPQDSPFWRSVYTFLARQPTLDSGQVFVILDYIHAVKFRRPVLSGDVHGEPSLPSFEMKGRTVQSLLHAAREWHNELNREQILRNHSWWPCSLKPYLAGSDEYDFGVVELLTSEELQVEGRALQHCVASYAGACASRKSAIFSCQRWMKDTTHIVERLLTIEVINNSIVQARGKYNAAPSGMGQELMKGFAAFNGLITRGV